MAAVLSVLLCLLLIGGDQFIKYLVVEYLKPIEYVDVIDGFLRFRYVENTGAVFGSFATHTVLLTILSIILLVFTVYFLVTNKSKSKLVNFCLLLMISGGIGNIIDRIRLQYVVDYIEPLFVEFAVFNFADCLITVGAFVLIIYLVIDLIKDIKKDKSPQEDDADSDDEVSEEGKKTRFAFKRKVKKAEVEGDKEAVVFNAVIEGESPDEALNEIKMGIETKPGISASEDSAEASAGEDEEDETVIVSLADKNSDISTRASEAILKADNAVKKADEIINTTKNIENDIENLKQKADLLSAGVKSDITEHSVDAPTDNTDNSGADTATEGKSKKLSIDSIDDLDFSLFE